MAAYENAELLIRVGEYSEGSDATTDTAIAKREAIQAFLRQGTREFSAFDETLEKMQSLEG